MVNNQGRINSTRTVFQQMDAHRNAMPIMRIVLLVIGGLFLAGWVEAHVTQRIVELL
jgi:hypothetical protein